MDCNYANCRRQSEDTFTCENCYVPKYCSERCRNSDAQTHEKWCRPRQFSLKDFVSVKTSRKILDVGTYGEVQLMQNVTNNKLYAIKVIRKSMLTHVIPLKVLYREIMIHKTLVHPNIVRLVDHFDESTKIFLVLEFVEKGSLFDLIRRKTKLSETEACEIFVQTCVGLNYLHQNDIVHRDIKPENLLISKDEVVKICDFGWSAQGSEKRVTFCGTLDYLSPEMINSEPHTNKLDIWALGILLFEMLHGHPPFRGTNPREQYRLIAAGSYTIEPFVSRSAAALIRSILQLNANNRPSIVDILKSQWVQEYAESRLQKDWRVSGKLGEGIISSVLGKVVTISVKSSKTQMLEAEVLRSCVLYDESHRLIHTPPEEESLPARFDPANSSILVNSLYKKLGIDSGRATPLGSAGGQSGRNSRRGSVVGLTPAPPPRLVNVRSSCELSRSAKRLTDEASPAERSDRTELSPVLKQSRPPKGPRQEEEVKRSQPVLSTRTGREKQDFENIELKPAEVPAPQAQKGRPKSSFLSKFNKGLISK
jgi:serine/threonine protein kinase